MRDDSNSCVIRRQHISDYCKMQAAYLSKLIYEKPQGYSPFDTSWPEEINKARENWQEWKDFDKQEDYGFVARLYKPKGYNPNAQNGDEMCWPTLVFRGTDFDDFRGLGLYVRIRLEALANLIEDIKARGWNEIKGMVGAGETEEELQRKIAEAKEEAREQARQKARATTEEGTAARVEALAAAEHADSILVEQTIILDADFLAAHQENYTRADAIKAGFTVRPELSFTLNGPIGGLLAGEAEIKVEILTKGGTGDWINNLLQGIGDIENSSQYKYAMDTAKEVIEKYVKPSHDRRLTITGHSLGGGLATAADFTARYNYYKENIQFYTLIFNPAGLHEDTIQYIRNDSETAVDVQAAHEEALQRVNQDFDEIVKEALKRNKEQAKNCVPKPKLSDGASIVYRVKDEILTTLEYTPHHIPFLQGVMDILDQRFPKPQGVDNLMPALSPGWNNAQQQAKKDEIRTRATLGRSSLFYNPPDQGYVPSAKKFEPLPVLFPLDEQKFPHILALSAIFANYGRWMRSEITAVQSYDAFSRCLNEMVDYLDGALFAGKLSQYINGKGEDRSVASLVPGGLRGVKLYLFGEISALQRLMALSAEYHGMDYVIASYEGILQQRSRAQQQVGDGLIQQYAPSADSWQNLFNMR